ncbi:unnamed protein product [Camellia sinensis]
MDIEHHKQTSLSGHENHGVHLCHKCGWPFPNPHPSAKQRRAHKKICGTIEGYTMIDSGDHSNLTVSDDEHDSDDDRQRSLSENSGPKIEKRMTKEFSRGGVGGISNRSEEDVFSDAVTEFLDTGFGPGSEKVVEGDQGTNQQLKVDATTGFVQLPNTSTESSQMHNPNILETATNLLGSATPSDDIALSSYSDSVISFKNMTEELAVGIGGVNGSADDFSPSKSETLTDAPKEHMKEDIGDHAMKYSTVPLEHETDVKRNEESNVDKVLSDFSVTPSETATEVSEVACKLQEMDLKISDSATENQIVESKEEQSHELGPAISLRDLSPEVKSFEHIEAVKNIDVGSRGNSVEDSYTNGEGNVNVHVLSVATDIPVIDHAEIMIKDFKDHTGVKSNLPLPLDFGEVIEPVVDNNQDNITQKGREYVLVAQIEGLAKTSELMVSSEVLGPKDVEAPPETTKSGTQKIQTDAHLEGHQPRDFHNDSSQEYLPEPTTRGLSAVIPMPISMDDKVGHSTNLKGGVNADDHEMDKLEKCDTDGKASREVDEKDDFSVTKADQSTNLLGAGTSGEHENAGIKISDLAGNESRGVAVEEKPEMSSEPTLESACRLSEPHTAASDRIDTATTTYFVSNSCEVGPDSNHLGIVAPTHFDSQNFQDEDSQEATKKPNCSIKNEVLAESVGAKSNHDDDAEIIQKISENPTEHLPLESEYTMKSSATVEYNHCEDGDLGDEKFTKQPVEVSAVYISVDSQTDSLEGNWGSVSVLSTQSDAPAATDELSPSNASQAPAQSEKVNLQKPQTTSEGHYCNQSDVFEAPSFMTLVERGNGGVDKKGASLDIQTGQNTRQPKSEALQGKKKNEEIIAKVTNWSAGKQQHTPLKTLLSEAKSKLPNSNQTVKTVVKKDENATKINDASETSVNSLVDREDPTEIKKEKRKVKGRPYWVPFGCCSSVN